MPKKKKADIDLTTDEVAKKLFPKKVRDKLKEIAHEGDNQPNTKSSLQE